MASLAQELLTRFVPLDPAEGAYARNRPVADRPAWPRPEDRVYFRRGEWDTDEQLHLMHVVDVQDPADITSEWATNLWQHLRHNITGEPLYRADGRPVLVPLEDPWPWVHLTWPPGRDIPEGPEWLWAYRTQMTFESRMRGSPGWLPLDYQTARQIQQPGRIPHRAGTMYRYRDDIDQIEQLVPDGGDVWRPYP